MSAPEVETAATLDAPPPYGLLAEFTSAAALLHACERVRDAGYTRWDAHSPFPVHGLDRALGLRPSRVPWAVLGGALLGASGGMLLQWWAATIAYPLVISGKPLFSYPAFVPITFELAVICGVVGGLLAMLHLNRLPRHYHPLFRSTRFERVSDDRFFISIEAADPRFDLEETRAWLASLGAASVEAVQP
jgi:hypothetical protein